jgi:hypothetical protein
MDILCTEFFCLQKKKQNRTLLCGSTLLKHGRHLDHWNQPLNMRIHICYLDCHEVGLCCCLVTYIKPIVSITAVLLPFVTHLLTLTRAIAFCWELRRLEEVSGVCIYVWRVVPLLTSVLQFGGHNTWTLEHAQELQAVICTMSSSSWNSTGVSARLGTLHFRPTRRRTPCTPFTNVVLHIAYCRGYI